MQDETKAREVLAGTMPEGSAVQRLVLSGQSPDQEIFTIAEAIRAMLAFASAPPDGEREAFDGAGFVYWNPDSGEEYAPNHPIDSGECVEAERVRRSTGQEDALHAAFQEQWKKAEALSLPHQADREAIAREGAELQSIYDVLHCIYDTCEDEGDRIYFGSTNDRWTMQRQLRRLEKLLALSPTPSATLPPATEKAER